ncbi:SIR2 family protein [Bradyrhizobium australafricanum]|uniref:SIR2 family protein n=1 Tax=Bradyrhizobium australafricanum TaxID=2821406 RepID=UPI001CE2987E|nr:SIR2 family protein [Bradyrhizobium australafricanum]MCA6101956.1 SIR2 family protein [Bradyrhizobium australafricanum]
MIDPSDALAFSVYENKAVYCVLLGSGVSRGAEVPTGWEITLDLVQRVASLEGVKDQVNWAAWYKEAHGKEPGYSDLLDQLATTSDERRSILHSYIEPDESDVSAGRKVPTKAHRAIARLVQAGYVRVILTTNFDRLMENALRDVGVEPTVIGSEDGLKGAVPLIHSRCYVLKLHGDYLDTRILNTELELSAYTAPMNTLLDRIVDEHGLIICGWSGDWDPALRAAIMRAPNRRYPLYWAARGEPSKVAVDLITQRAGRVISIESADTFFERLEQQVSTQSEMRRQNPSTVELMVASAKRFLAKPEFRIQLDELVGEEARKLERALTGAGFATNGEVSKQTFPRIVGRYEAITEPLARIVSVLGRWGADAELRVVIDLLAQFGVKEPTGGTVALINLRSYPAVLLLYAHGLGLLAARRYADLFRLFATRLTTDRDRTIPVVAHLLLNAWDGGSNDTWRLLPNSERLRTALSDHLHDIFRSWSSDYFYSSKDYTLFFEEFETLGTLAHISTSTNKKELSAALAGEGGRKFVWCAIGRVSWDDQSRRKILEKWQSEEIAGELTKAGFALGDREYLTLARTNINNFSSVLQWSS